MIDKLYEILMSDNVVESINDNMVVLLEIIPEIKDMIGFLHNHPHHHLDVWHHTLLALSLSCLDFDVRLVLLLHDIGKPHSYQDDEVRHFKGHAEVSSRMADEILGRLNFAEQKKNELVYLIKEHDTMISKVDIDTNRELAIKRFCVQYCDALAHNPNKLENRLKYLNKVSKELSIRVDTSYVKKLEIN